MITNVPKTSAEQLKEKVMQVFSGNKGEGYHKVNSIGFMSESNKTYVCCSSSKFYSSGQHSYWYTLSRTHFEKMQKTSNGYYILCCMEHNKAYAIPMNIIEKNIKYLSRNVIADEISGWHMWLSLTKEGMVLWRRPDADGGLNIEKFSFEVEAKNNAERIDLMAEEKNNATPMMSAEKFREKIIKAFSSKTGESYRKVNRTAFINESGKVYVCSSISKLHSCNPNIYWYGLNLNHFERMKKADDGYYILGCMKDNKAFAIPRNVIEKNIKYLNHTNKKGSFYWHIELSLTKKSTILKRKKSVGNLNIEEFSFDVGAVDDAEFETNATFVINETDDTEMAVDIMEGIEFEDIDDIEFKKANAITPRKINITNNDYSDGKKPLQNPIQKPSKNPSKKSYIWWVIGAIVIWGFFYK